MLMTSLALTLSLGGPPPQLPPIQRPTPPPTQHEAGPTPDPAPEQPVQPADPAPAQPAPDPAPDPTPTQPNPGPASPSPSPSPAQPGQPSPMPEEIPEPPPEPTGVPTPPEFPPVPADPDVQPVDPSPSPYPPQPDTPAPFGPSASASATQDEGAAPLVDQGHREMLPPPPPPPPAAPPAPPNGSGFLTSGAILGGSGLLVRVWTTAAAVRARRRLDDGDPNTSHLSVVALGSIFYTPLIASGLVTAGIGMGRRGHAHAHAELFRYQPATWKRRAWLGWGLFAGGMLVWTVTRSGILCSSYTCAFRTSELGYYASLAGTVPGIVLGSYGSGFASYRKRHLPKWRRNRLGMAPMVTRELQGVSIGGQF